MVFLNGPSSAYFSFIFGPFQTNINTILQQINLKKCPSSIRHRDLNPRPSECESPPITTRPGLPPTVVILIPINRYRLIPTYLYYDSTLLRCLNLYIDTVLIPTFLRFDNVAIPRYIPLSRHCFYPISH